MTHKLLSIATGSLVCFLSITSLVGDEPSQTFNYRGPDTSGVYADTGLLPQWPDEGPPLLWQADVEIGACPPTVAGEKVYVVGGGNATLRVFSLDGKLLNEVPIASASWKRFGFPRSAPIVADGIATVPLPNADIYGVDLSKMEKRWKINTWQSFGSGQGSMGWGLPESPVLHESKMIFNAVSRDDQTPPLLAVDLQNADRVVWSMDAGTGKAYSMPDVSAALFNHGGRDLLVSPTYCYLVCLDADTGKVLWEIPGPGSKNLTPVYRDGWLLAPVCREVYRDEEAATPLWPGVPVDPSALPGKLPEAKASPTDDEPDDGVPPTLRERMKQSRWGGEELALFRLSDDGRTARAHWVRSDSPGRFSHAVVLDGRIYCFGDPDAPVEPAIDGGIPPLTSRPRRSRRGQELLCLDMKTGKPIASAPAGTPGHVVAADGMVYAVDLLHIADPRDPKARPRLCPRIRLIRPTREGFEVAGELRPFGYHDVPMLRDGEWEASVPPVIAHGRMFWRYGKLLVYDLRGKTFQPAPPPAQPNEAPTVARAAFPVKEPGQVRAEHVPALLELLGSRLEADRKLAAKLLVAPGARKDDELATKLAQRMTTGGPDAWPAQVAAAEALLALGKEARPAVPTLHKMLPQVLRQRDGTLGRLIVLTLRDIDEESLAAVAEPVGKLLSERDPHVQYLAAAMLKRMGPRGTGAATALAGAADAENLHVMYEVGAALAAVGGNAKPTAPALCRQLVSSVKRGDVRRCDLLVAALRAIDETALEPAIPDLAGLLGHEDESVRLLAARTLDRAGPAAANAAGQLVGAMRGQDEELRALASKALSAMESRAAATALAKVVAEGKGQARLTAAEVLAEMGPAAAPATAALSKAAGDADVEVAKAAIAALSAIGPDAQEAAPVLAKALNHEDVDVARRAAAALGRIGPAAKPQAEALTAALRHRDTTVRDHAAASLAQIGRSPVPVLVELVRGEDGRLRQWAAGALASFGDGADQSVPALAEALGSSDVRLAQTAAQSLGKLGPKAAPAVPALLKAIDAEDERLASYAMYALGAIGEAARSALPRLLEVAASEDGRRAGPAIRAIGGMGAAASSAIKPLVELAASTDRRRADAISRTLQEIKTENVPPKADDVKATCREGQKVVIELPITDPDDVAALLEVRPASRPAHGSVDRKATGSLTYVSHPGFVGEDRFTWKVRDRSRAESREATAIVTVTADTTAPRIARVAAQIGRDDTVVVTFDEPVNRKSAETIAHYTIDHGVRIIKARLKEDERTVVLTTSPLAAKTDYSLSVAGVADQAKAANACRDSAPFVHKVLWPGLAYRYYASQPRDKELAAFDGLTAKQTGVTATVGVPLEKHADSFALRLDGYLEVPRGGGAGDFRRYVFHTVSTGPSRLYINGRLLLDNRGGGGNGREEVRETTLAPGLHAITITYRQGKGTPVFNAGWSGPGITKQAFTPGVLKHAADE